MKRWLLWAVVLTACPRPTPPPALSVEVAGCQTVLTGPRCLLAPDRTLRLWTPYPGDLRFDVDETRLEPIAHPVDRGSAWTVSLPTDATQLVVTATTQARWTLPVGTATTSPKLSRVKTLRQSGHRDQARDLLKTISPVTDGERALVLGLEARLDRDNGRWDDATRRLRRAIELHRRAGRLSDEAHDRLALVDIELKWRRYAAVSKILDERHPCFVFEDAVSARYYRGRAAKELGDIRTALRVLEDTEQSAERLGMETISNAATQVRSMVLHQLGRTDQTFDAMQKIILRSQGCAKAVAHANTAWLALLLEEQGRAAPVNPLTHLDRALAGYAEECRQAARLANAHVNRALAHVHRNQPDRARADLKAARQAADPLPPRLDVWAQDIEGRIALAEDRPSNAAGIYRALLDRLSDDAPPDDRWRAALGLGHAERKRGRTAAAEAAYRQAEAIVERATDRVPPGLGRSQFSAGRTQGVMHLADIALERGAPDRALAAIRRARARNVRRLIRNLRLAELSPVERQRWSKALGAYQQLRDRQARRRSERWKLSKAALERQRTVQTEEDEAIRQAWSRLLEVLGLPSSLQNDEPRRLPPIAKENEIALVYHPLPDGWGAIAVFKDQIEVRRLGPWPETEESLGEYLLAPFQSMILDAHRVRVLASGRARQVDMHALAFRGRPLITHRPVVYGLDLGSKPPPKRRGRALVITDPKNNLAGARTEGRWVSAHLADRGISVKSLSGREATLTSLQQYLGQVDLIHFAGHGHFAGTDGLESALMLAGNDRITAGEILAQPTVPSAVVLSSCEGGVPAVHADTAPVAMARAFVLAGARIVVAATRKVDDRLARRFVQRLYEGSRPDLTPEAVHRAQRALFVETPDSDWAAFRVYVP